MSKVAVIIPAAGKSRRFGGGEKKPYVTLDGRPVWQRSAELFWSRDDVSRVYLVLAPGDRDDFRSKYGHLIAFANLQLVDGGEERFDSVANALDQIADSADFIAVHDAVRPLTTREVIDSVFHAAATHGAAMVGVPVADTLKRVDPTSNSIIETIPRAGLWSAQTPQVFRRDWLLTAYARRHEFPGTITDDSQLIEAIGHSVVVVPGLPSNFKITTKEDLEIAEAIVKARGTKPVKMAFSYGDEAKW